MCGIVGYIGEEEAPSILLEGLKRLEYRGYDSAGIAVSDGYNINVVKKAGKLKELENIVFSSPPAGTAGIGHTRWATHGVPSEKNSHPHYDCHENIVVVHNGIIENFQELKEGLEAAGHSFVSDTDTEVIAHLIEDYYNGDLKDAVFKAVQKLDGSYALAVMTKEEPNKIIAVRKDSPLIIGKGQGENYIASDIPAFLNNTRSFYILDDGEIAEVSKDKVVIYDKNGVSIDKEIFKVDWDPEMAEKNGYEHYMLKEIHEQPDALRRVLANRVSTQGVNLDEIGLTAEELKKYSQIQVVACGTAYYSGMVGKYIIEELARIPVKVDVASEFRYSNPIIDKDTLVIVVSQSGETADTLAGLRLAREKGAEVLALTNVVGSTIAREADRVLYLKAGPEIAVASTKAYLTMVSVFYLLAVQFAKIKGTINDDEYMGLVSDLIRLPELASETIKVSEEKAKEKARYFIDYDNSFYIGRNFDYTIALEGALKLKEISYLHAEAYPAGELKHGPLALIEEGIPVVAVVTRRSLYDKMLSNIKEVKARGANITAVAIAGDAEVEKAVDDVIFIPECNEFFSGLLAVIPLQLLAYYTAVGRGFDVDQPRNLAKSVTVE
ncbi:glutamine--fructose-6-phosphate transaminase (isomerizing) [Halothermothrix orenii]|uniref:Glutamine--fructose-6-phosphate aminotransferase [isomerizing] n=1 Tax=Halothermothrix orenii (strain H 168 / OCM 544 / DSM 9562) TaxID=373903 RepID=B8D0V0_HALOH|nr:glutamine--fructose-6-phosphate transaminase (isomerizing) [Halothermothrix orenii]ACL68919.1 glucosamine--fructose-6-phosphate aminotransferase, isomerizing [Halothermothrix orenii H 168]